MSTQIRDLYKGVTAATVAAANALIAGERQKMIITVTADENNGGATTRYTYEGSGGLVADFQLYSSTFFDTVGGEIVPKDASITEAKLATEVTDLLGGTIQPETKAYLANITTAGGRIDAFTLNVIDKFICSGKRNGWWDTQKDMGFFLNTTGTISGTLIKLKNVANKAMSNGGYLDADIRNYGLFSGDTNASKYISTGASFADLGMSLSNFSVTVFAPLEGSEDIRFRRDRGGTGGGALLSTWVDENTESRFSIHTNQAVIIGTKSYNGQFLGVNSLTSNGSGGFTVYVNGTNYLTMNNIGTATINGVIQLSKSRNDVGVFYTNLPLSFYSAGTAMTDIQSRLFSKDLLVLMTELGRIGTRNPFCIGFGDSIGEGSNATSIVDSWMHQASRKLGFANLNVSKGGRESAGDVNTSDEKILAGSGIFQQGIDLGLVSNAYYALGTNDMRNRDYNENDFGDPNRLNSYFSSLMDAVGQIINQGINTFLVTPSTNYENLTNFSVNKQLDYVKKSASAFKILRAEKGYAKLYFVNLYHLFFDLGTTGYVNDGVHFSDEGHRAASEEVVRVAKTMSQIRNVTLDFPSIAAQSSANLTVMVLTAVVGNETRITPPATLESGLVVSAFVSADDTVTVRLTNITGSAIDPASGKFIVTVFN